MPKYVKAEPGPGKSVIYTDTDGSSGNLMAELDPGEIKTLEISFLEK
jgi:hypothetical protein